MRETIPVTSEPRMLLWMASEIGIGIITIGKSEVQTEPDTESSGSITVPSGSITIPAGKEVYTYNILIKWDS